MNLSGYAQAFLMQASVGCCSLTASHPLAVLGQRITGSLLSQLQADPQLAHRCQDVLRDDVGRKQNIVLRAGAALVCSLTSMYFFNIQQKYVLFDCLILGWSRISSLAATTLRPGQMKRTSLCQV